MDSAKLKIINTKGNFKVGFKHWGPKIFLGETLKIDDIAINIYRDTMVSNPCVWLMGPIERVIDYLYLARSKGYFEYDEVGFLLNSVAFARKNAPKTATKMLSNALDIDELKIEDALVETKIYLSRIYINNYKNDNISHMPKALDRLSEKLKVSRQRLEQMLGLCHLLVMEE